MYSIYAHWNIFKDFVLLGECKTSFKKANQKNFEVVGDP
jgi:hypothetical protein